MKGQKNDKDVKHALPAFSVDTVEQAEQIMVHFCKKPWKEGARWLWTNFEPDNIDSLHKATEQMRDFWDRFLSKKEK